MFRIRVICMSEHKSIDNVIRFYTVNKIETILKYNYSLLLHLTQKFINKYI